MKTLKVLIILYNSKAVSTYNQEGVYKMAELMEIYKCESCSNIIEVLNGGVGELVCCGQPMTLLKEQDKNTEMLHEKHVPVMIEENGKQIIRVGSVPHPMEDAHYIMFIEVISEDKKFLKRKYLAPHEAPELELKCKCSAKKIARELCNLHGLWKGDINE